MTLCIGKLSLNQMNCLGNVQLNFLKYALIAMVTALLITGGAVALSCDEANSLLNATLYDEAKANYTDLLNKDPQLPCAQTGILAVKRAQAIKSYESGRAYENASQINEAKIAYLEALKNYPTFGDAQEALNRMNGGILTLTYTWYTHPYLDIIMAGAIVFLVILVSKFKIIPSIIGFCRPSLDIKEFDKGTTNLEISKGLKAMVGASYKQLVRGGRHRGVDCVDGAPTKLDIPSDEKVVPYFKFVFELIDWLFPPNVIELSGSLQKQSPGIGITVALVDNRTRKILDSQTIWQNELDLETTPKTAEKTIVPTSIDATSYYRLAEPVAIWVLFQLGKRYQKEEFTMSGTNDWRSYIYFKAGFYWQMQGNLDKARQLYIEALNHSKKNMGALFNLGRMEIEDGQYEHAYGRLKQVRELSNSNNTDKKSMFTKNIIWYLASYNIALTLRYMSKQYNNNLSRAKKATKELIETIEKTRIAIRKNDETLLKSDISIAEEKAKTLLETIHETIDELQTAEHIAAEYISQSSEGELTNQVDSIKKAIDEWYLAEQKIRTIQKDIGKWSIEKQEKRLEGTITDIQKMGSSENKHAPFEIIKFMAQQEAKDLMVKVREANKATQKNSTKEMEEFLDSFYPTACIMSANTLLYVDKIDDAMSEIDAVKPFEKLNYRSRYNLACFYSIYGEKDKRKYRNALNNLEYALERGGAIVQWAQRDPSLKGVCDDESTKEDFARLIKKYSQPPTQASSEKLPMASLTIIQEKYAIQLKEQGTVSPCDLILNAGTPSAREALAKKLGISIKLLHRWALLADLMRIVEDTKQINLLEAADYGSIEALQKVKDPCELVDLLNQVNKAQSLVEQSPSYETVQKWLQEAKKTKLMVVDNHSVIK